MSYYDKEMERIRALRDKRDKLYDSYSKIYEEYEDAKREIKKEELRLSKEFPATEKQVKTILFINSRLSTGITPTNKIDAIEFIGKYMKMAQEEPVPEYKSSRSLNHSPGCGPSPSYNDSYSDNDSYSNSSYSSSECDGCGGNCRSCRFSGLCDLEDELNYEDD